MSVRRSPLGEVIVLGGDGGGVVAGGSVREISRAFGASGSALSRTRWPGLFATAPG
jgi:hypothetical protein